MFVSTLKTTLKASGAAALIAVLSPRVPSQLMLRLIYMRRGLSL